MKIVTWILNFYPHRWRERYQEEMLAVLEQHTISLVTLLDLLLGALDARLDPAYPTKEGFMFHRLRDTRTLSHLSMRALHFPVLCDSLDCSEWFAGFSRQCSW